MISIAFSGLKFINNINKKEKLLNIFKKIFSKDKNKNKEKENNKLNDWIKEYQETKNEEVFNNIYKIYEPYIENKAKKENNININFASECNLALYNAVMNFDVDNKTNASFNTFFFKCIKNQINVINNNLNAKKREANKNTISIQRNNSDGENKETTLEDIIEDKNQEESFKNVEFNIILQKLLSKLKDDEKKAVKLIIAGYSLKEIGEILGNITAPAIFTKLRRLRNKKSIQKELDALLCY